MRKTRPRLSRLRPTKEVSVIAWIEDATSGVLLVRQAAGLNQWTLPGGKVKKVESVVRALKREVREETGLVLRLVRFWECLTGAIRTQSLCSLPRFPVRGRERLCRSKTKLRRRVFKRIRLTKLCHPLNTSGPREGARQKGTENSGLNLSISGIATQHKAERPHQERFVTIELIRKNGFNQPNPSPVVVAGRYSHPIQP